MATKKPSGGVSSLSISRGSGNRTLTAKWKVPAALKKSTKKAGAATGLTVTFGLGIAGTDPKYAAKKGISVTSLAANLDSIKAGNKSYNRRSFYPLGSTRLDYVTCQVVATNKGGSSKTKPSVTYKFAKPAKPTVEALAMDPETGIVSSTITAAADSGSAERYDTEWYWTVRDSSTGETVHDEHSSSTAATIPISYNASSYQELPQGAYLECTLRARSRGYAGDSDWVEAQTYYIAYPQIPTISGVSVSGTDATDRVTVSVATNADAQHPVTQVRLEALADVAYATADEAAAATDDWEEVGAPDDGECTALACLVGDLMPSAGNHSWVRVRSWYLVEDVLASHSRPVEVEALHRPAATVTDDAVAIVGHESGEDGTTVLVTLAWAPAGTTDTSDGTELSWSDQLDTWRSTDEPDTYEVTYDDGPIVAGGVTYQSSATIAIKGLGEGETTYIRARRYRDDDGTLVYGPYGNTEVVIPSVAPASVVLDCPAYVPEGQGVTCRWTFSGGSTQTAWQLLDGDGVVVAEGTDAMGAATVPATRVESLAQGGSLTLSVAVSTGGAWVTSAPRTVHVTERPTLSVAPSATYSAQPVAIPLSCATPGASVALVVTSLGTDGDGPGGMVLQAAGDVVWSDVVLPQWSAGAATVTLPAGLQFVDGTGYRVSATATDPATGLSSDPVAATFGVAWAHQAPDPDGCATVTHLDVTDGEGRHLQGVRIDLVPPADSIAGDVWDVYRVTGDGPQLIGSGWPLTSTVTDQWAPFGTGMEHEYRVACRTADGDVSWADVPYDAAGTALRIDWAGGSVELPYDLAISDGYSKDVEVHEYLDGSTDAYYNQGIRRTARFSTNVLRLADPDVVAAVRELARFVGPAFVRTPDGSAYEADVQVTDLTPTWELAAVSISATEVALTPEYMLPPTEEE